MSELTFLVLKVGFLILLWFFVFALVYALRTDLFGDRERRRQPAGAAAGGQAAAPAKAPKAPKPAAAPKKPSGAATSSTASRVVLLSGPRGGDEFPLGRDPITIGRAPDSTIVLRDDYTSTRHARLVLWDEQWMIQDMDSTNGTFLDGVRVGAPTAVPLGTVVKVGATSLELRP